MVSRRISGGAALETSKGISLIQPRQSPKMERIYAALEQGWPGARVNSGLFNNYVIWGLIGNNTQIMDSGDNYIFVTCLTMEGMTQIMKTGITHIGDGVQIVCMIIVD